jgi:hypothetical protein
MREPADRAAPYDSSSVWESGWSGYALTFPIGGSCFDPRVTGLLLAGCATAVTIVWGADTLRRSRAQRS